MGAPLRHPCHCVRLTLVHENKTEALMDTKPWRRQKSWRMIPEFLENGDGLVSWTRIDRRLSAETFEAIDGPARSGTGNISRNTWKPKQ